MNQQKAAGNPAAFSFFEYKKGGQIPFGICPPIMAWCSKKDISFCCLRSENRVILEPQGLIQIFLIWDHKEIYTMYCTSTQVKALSDSDFISFEQKGISKFPQPYVDFMKTYGIGTYGGAICIGAPDFDILKNFAEYHFWKFKDAPISEEQFCECVVIGNSIDGDYIALHSQVEGYILFPRDSDVIKLFPYDEESLLFFQDGELIEAGTYPKYYLTIPSEVDKMLPTTEVRISFGPSEKILEISLSQ